MDTFHSAAISLIILICFQGITSNFIIMVVDPTVIKVVIHSRGRVEEMTVH